jgi:crotonobetainyl-CoA:carnitine CoA-transferase CaiB-like acyl-CoA transferase
VHGVTRLLEYALPLYGKHGIVRERWGNWDTQLCVHGIVKCGKSSYPNSENPQEAEEGYILISAYSDPDFARLCKAVGNAELAAKYAKHVNRVQPKAQIEIYEALEKWAADKTKEQVAAILDSANLINQPVWNSKEVANHPHFQERGSVRWLDDPTYGEMLHQGPAYKMSHTPPRTKWALKPVGADNEYVLGRLAGLSPEELKRLEDQECI